MLPKQPGAAAVLCDRLKQKQPEIDREVRREMQRLLKDVRDTARAVGTWPDPPPLLWPGAILPNVVAAIEHAKPRTAEAEAVIQFMGECADLFAHGQRSNLKGSLAAKVAERLEEIGTAIAEKRARPQDVAGAQLYRIASRAWRQIATEFQRLGIAKICPRCSCLNLARNPRSLYCTDQCKWASHKQSQRKRTVVIVVGEQRQEIPCPSGPLKVILGQKSSITVSFHRGRIASVASEGGARATRPNRKSKYRRIFFLSGITPQRIKGSLFLADSAA